jgi:glycosyltransferase involved in cell wall biosynthesis
MPDPLRVLFLNDTSRNGGPGRTLESILRHLPEGKVFRTVVVPRDGVVADLMRAPGVADEVHLLPDLVENVVEPWGRAIVREDFQAPVALRTVRAAGNVVRGSKAMVELLQIAKRGRYDAIFCNGTTANFAGGALARWTNIPVIWHAFYTDVARPIRRLHRRLAASANVRSILCVSEPVARLFDHCRDKVRIVHDAIDLAQFDKDRVSSTLRSELGVGEGVVIFGSQGRVLPKKGYLEMIRAARIVKDELGSGASNVRFVLVGDTPDDMQPDHLVECRALVRSLGLEDVFTFTGYRADVRPLVSDFDVSVVPSTYEDPLPRSVLEAMAMEKPVIAFDRGGIPEMIDDGVTGCLVAGAPPDVQGLAAKMLDLYRSPSLRKTMGAAARRKVEGEFDAKAHGWTIFRELSAVARPVRKSSML